MDSPTMNLFERVKQHWIGGVIAIAFLCISTTWFAINEIHVKPRDFEIEKQTKEILNLRLQIEKLDKEVTDLRARITNASRQIGSLQAQLTNSNQQVSDLKVQLVNSNKQVNDLNSQLALANKQVKNLKAQLEVLAIGAYLSLIIGLILILSGLGVFNSLSSDKTP